MAGGRVVVMACVATAVGLAVALAPGSASRAVREPCRPQVSPVERPALTRAVVLDVAASPRGVWAVGSPYLDAPRSLILHWDGQSVRSMANPGRGELRAVAAVSDDDVWAVGLSTVLHWDGHAWHRSPAPTGRYDSYWGVSADGPDDVWAVGTSEHGLLVIRWDGHHWAKVPFPSIATIHETVSPHDTLVSMALLQDVLVVGRNDVWVVGNTVHRHPLAEHWDGRHWTTMVPGWTGSFDSLEAGSDGTVWAGDPGYFEAAQWDGHRWVRRGHLGMIDFALVRGRVWAISQSAMWEWEGGTHWQRLTRLPAMNVAGMTVDSRGDVWVVGDRGAPMLRYVCR